MAEPAEQPDDVGELTDLDIDAVHAVGKAANGTTILLAKSAAAAADDQAGLFGADYVRELIAKGEATEAAPEERLTPAQAMALIHAASVRKADLSTADVNDLPDSAFAHIEPGGKQDGDGKTTPRGLRHYPVHDQAHARNALGRAQAQISDGDEDGKRIARAALPKIKAAAKKFGIKVAKADGTDGEPGSPAWEGQDAASAQALIDRILAVIPDVNALARREGAEVGAGHMDDLADVFDLNAAADALMCAAKTLGGFAVSEHAEAGEPVTKAQDAPNTSAAPATPTPQESTVTSTTDGAQPGAATTDTAEVAKGAGGMTEAQLADFGRLALAKAAAKAAKKKAKASGAAQAPDARVIPGTDTVQAPAQGPDDVMKAQAAQFVDAMSQAMAPLAKQLGELAGVVKAQDERVNKLMVQPDDRKSPLLNGAIGEPSLAMRGDGPTATPEFRAVLKAIEEIPEGPAREQAQKGVALAALRARFAPGS